VCVILWLLARRVNDEIMVRIKDQSPSSAEMSAALSPRP